MPFTLPLESGRGIVHQLLSAGRDGTSEYAPLTDEEVIDQTLMFYAAGHETTGTSYGLGCCLLSESLAFSHFSFVWGRAFLPRVGLALSFITWPSTLPYRRRFIKK